MSYKIVILPSAEKEIKKLSKPIGQDVIAKIYALATNPRPHGYKKLTNFKLPSLKLKPLYRIRVGDFRIVYVIQDDIITVTIGKVGDRKEVYE